MNINDPLKSKRNYRHLFTYKKLSVLIRTILSLIKLLPLNSFKYSNIFDIQSEVTLDTKNEFDPGEKYDTMNFQNYSDSIGSLKFEVKYLAKTSIFKIEEIKKQDFYSKIENYQSNLSSNSLGSKLLTRDLNDYVSVEIMKNEKRSLSPKYSEATNASSSMSESNSNKQISNEIVTKSFLDFVLKENNLNSKYQEITFMKIHKDLIDFKNINSNYQKKGENETDSELSDYEDLKEYNINFSHDGSFSEYDLEFHENELVSSKEIQKIENNFSVTKFIHSYQNIKKNLENSVYSLNIVNLMKCKNLFLK
jgi:hypothetical protein